MSDSSDATLQIKGVSDGLMVSLGEGTWSEVMESLLATIDTRNQFFKGAKLTLDVHHRIIYSADLGLLRDKLADRDVILWGVLSTSLVTEQTARMLGLATRIHSSRPMEQTVKPVESSLAGEEAVFVHRTLRSGIQVASKNHVVVVGDVNPGAEILAGGNVVVWGKLRGSVEAGLETGEQASICALELAPMKIWIGGQVINLPSRRGIIHPEMVSIKDGQLIIEPWKTKEK